MLATARENLGVSSSLGLCFDRFLVSLRNPLGECLPNQYSTLWVSLDIDAKRQCELFLGLAHAFVNPLR